MRNRTLHCMNASFRIPNFRHVLFVSFLSRILSMPCITFFWILINGFKVTLLTPPQMVWQKVKYSTFAVLYNISVICLSVRQHYEF